MIKVSARPRRADRCEGSEIETLRELDRQLTERKDFASLRTAVSDDRKKNDESMMHVLAVMQNVKRGWLIVPRDPFKKSTTRRTTLEYNSARPAFVPHTYDMRWCGSTKVKVPQLNGVLSSLNTVRGEESDPIYRLLASINAKAKGSHRLGGGALGDVQKKSIEL